MLSTSLAVPRRLSRDNTATTREPSGAVWAGRYTGSSSTSTLSPRFQLSVDAFLAAMRAARIRVIVSATFRPVERSYLMHWSWKIVHGTDPALAPPLDGVNINWVHSTRAASVAAARQMVRAFDMDGLRTPPALRSLHNDRNAIDMTISWAGVVTIADQRGAAVRIDTLPRTGMNRQLQRVGASYGVTKFVGGESDQPHWSTTGR